MKGLTPYQGRNRAVGTFSCDCGHEWKSLYTWANTPQACMFCSKFVYPYEQCEVVDKKKDNHIQNLCGRCCRMEKSCESIN
jgi:hypothetical protein